MGSLDRYITDEYREQNAELHRRCKADGKPWGMSGHRYVDEVIAVAAEVFARDALVYGCGQGEMKAGIEAKIPLRVAEYDPALKGKDSPPRPADLVICTDVMEHVEDDKIGAVFDHIWRLANKGAYFAIACNDSHHKLPDGRSAHISIHPPQWWEDRIAKFPWYPVRIEKNKKLVKLWLKK